MMTFHLDARAALGLLASLHEETDRAIAIALNRTAEEGLAELREGVRARFVIRTPWILPPRELPRSERARPGRLGVTVQPGYAGGGGGERRALMLSDFEEGRPKLGRPMRAIPSDVLRPTPESVIPRSLFPVNLGFGARRDPKGRLYVARRDKEGTKRERERTRYMILGGPDWPGYGVYERIGPERDDIRAIWFYRPRTSTPPRLQFGDTIQRTAGERYIVNLFGAYDLLTRRR